jgi:DNA-binding transcriptional regulator YhcF (GntR family)
MTSDTDANRRIASELRSRIASGIYQEGQLLPSESMLAQEFGVSRGTVRVALRLLESDDLVKTRPGKGRFVRAGNVGGLPSLSHEEIASELRRGIAEGEYIQLDAPWGYWKQAGRSWQCMGEGGS